MAVDRVRSLRHRGATREASSEVAKPESFCYFGEVTTTVARIRIEGRVQGVWFRAWTVREALGRGLGGWVRNRADGSVEALFAGDPTTVDAMIQACRRGPPAADVRAVHRLPTTSTEPLPTDFAQRPTK